MPFKIEEEEKNQCNLKIGKNIKNQERKKKKSLKSVNNDVLKVLLSMVICLDKNLF